LTLRRGVDFYLFAQYVTGMRTGRPPINHKLGKPVVVRLVYQAHELHRLVKLRQWYSRAVTRQSFPDWIRTAAEMELGRRAFG